jgi:hypothetical protein
VTMHFINSRRNLTGSKCRVATRRRKLLTFYFLAVRRYFAITPWTMVGRVSLPEP